MSTETFAECVVKHALALNEFVAINFGQHAGTIQYLPNPAQPGYIDAVALRALAAELDRRNGVVQS